ncbi:MAG: NmrA/HSCARG family protein [Syntrophaceae bacterium]|nr:NmrA/HSCARG family protein [Syntrophaceae bacterium]
MTILVIGAAGNIAGLVVPALIDRGAAVKGFVPKPEQVPIAKQRGASDVAVGDLSDSASLDTALKGVEGVFHVGPVFAPTEVQMGKNMVDAARRAGVRKFVFSSVIHPVLSSLPNHAAKAPVEEALINSGLEYTILHPTMLFQNLAASWDRVIKTGVLAEPWSADTRFSRVDYRDVADVAAIAFTGDELAYGTFELCAPRIMNRHDVAALLSEVLHREIRVGTLDPSVLGDLPRDMKAMFEHYNHNGLLGSPLSLRTILGREPRTLQAYFEELAAGAGSSS